MVKITWLGHAGFLIEANGNKMLVDAWTDAPTFPKNVTLDEADFVLVTHGHADHMASAPTLAKQTNAKLVCIYDVSSWLAKKGVPQENIAGMNKGGTIDIGHGWKVTMTHAVHSSNIEELLAGGSAAGYIIHTPDNHRIYHAGDTAAFSDMKLLSDIYKPDIGLLPAGNFFTMGSLEASYAVNNLLMSLKHVFPMHWGTFPLLTDTGDDFKEKVTRDGVEVHVIEPGQHKEF